MSNTSLLGSFGGQAGDALMFRNKIINGAMEIDQRKAGAAVTVTANASSVYTLDRWRVFSAGSNATAQRVAGSGSNQYALRITGLASNTGTVLEQRIEATNCYDLVNNTVTVSFQVSSTSITSLNWSADYPTGGVDNWSGAATIASGSVTINSTNNTYSFTFNAGANVVNGLRITFTTGALLGSQTITYQQVQLEAGPVSTPFERRPIGTELALCQRYYEKSYDLTVAPANNALVDSRQGIATIFNNTELMSCPIPFKVTKRTGTPIVTTYKSSGPSGGVNGNWHYYAGAWVAFSVGSNVSQNYWMAVASSLSGVTNGQSFILSGGWSAESEL